MDADDSSIAYGSSRVHALMIGTRQPLDAILHLVPTVTLHMVVVALVHSRLGYRNSVLVGLPALPVTSAPVAVERSRPSGCLLYTSDAADE